MSSMSAGNLIRATELLIVLIVINFNGKKLGSLYIEAFLRLVPHYMCACGKV